MGEDAPTNVIWDRRLSDICCSGLWWQCKQRDKLLTVSSLSILDTQRWAYCVSNSSQARLTADYDPEVLYGGLGSGTIPSANTVFAAKVH